MTAALDSFRIDHVYREHNREADALANQAMDEVEGPDAKPRGERGAVKSAAPAASAASSHSPSSAPSASKPQPTSQLPSDVRKIRARYRSGVLYLLEDLEMPDGIELDILLKLPRKS